MLSQLRYLYLFESTIKIITNDLKRARQFVRLNSNSCNKEVRFLPVICKGKPVKMKLDSPEFKNLFTPEMNTLISLFKEYGYELRIAGGAVRDLLLNIQPKDLDFATVATPDQMKEMFNAKGIRMINMKGETHGTITSRINDKENFEITTLRIDVLTDGRRAQVEFTTDWEKDANRRDLTINSMFLDFDGTVYDYFSGYEDLKNRRVAFVGDAAIRIQEDYLRILRYFRFYGKIATEPNNHEEKTLHAIREHCDGLKQVSGERIWSELHRILTCNFAGDILKTMLSLNIGPYMGLPESPDLTELDIVWHRLKDMNYHPITLLASLFKNEHEMMAFHMRCKLSAFERDLGLFIVLHKEPKISAKPLKPYQDLFVLSKGSPVDTKKWIVELLKYKGEINLLEEFEKWEPPRFPITGHMLKDKVDIPVGKTFGRILLRLKEHWLNSDFTLSAEELLNTVPDVMYELGIEIKRKAKKNT